MLVGSFFKEPESGQGKYQLSLEHRVESKCKDDGNQNDENVLKDTGTNLKEIPLTK